MPTRRKKTKTTKKKTSASSLRERKPRTELPGGDTSGQSRAVIDDVRPNVERGAVEIKRVVGEPVRVEVDAFADSHDRLGVELRWRRVGAREWQSARLRESHNDTWLGSFTPDAMGAWEYQVEAWVDPFLSWAHDLVRRLEANQEIETDLQIGAAIVLDYSEGATPLLKKSLTALAEHLVDTKSPQRERGQRALEEEVACDMWEACPRRHAVRSNVYPMWVDREKALFSAWYELFPRSASPDPKRHGTFKDVIERLDYVQEMGFDVLYLPPIHPIGTTKRKGPNNAPEAGPNDPGSPWAIGNSSGAGDGGHKAIHAELGSMKDFEALVKAASAKGIEIALDIAFQCSPDHPWVSEHPEWFRHRPDGSIQYAENPPKKYQDIYPLNFECEAWRELWAELKSVFEFWIAKGVRIFRVDNPHTKSFGFWRWVIHAIRAEHPDVLFLSEAFTRPKKMLKLAKDGFTQSYTYFAWRNGAHELREYMEELTSPPFVDAMRPNFWPNTPDILTEYFQTGGRIAAMARVVLAATMTPSFGIYGPVFELCDFTPRPGVEENIDSEKYQQRTWDLEDRWSLRHFIGLLNRVRRAHPSLQQLRNIDFHHCDNPAHIAYSKRSHDGSDVVLVVVNVDHSSEQWGVARLNLGALGLEHDEAFIARDLLSGVSYEWSGADHTIGLGAGGAHVLHISTRSSGEQSFEHFA